jgi:hypothetical protein
MVFEKKLEAQQQTQLDKLLAAPKSSSFAVDLQEFHLAHNRV